MSLSPFQAISTCVFHSHTMIRTGSPLITHHTYKHMLSRLPIPFALHPPSALHHTLDHQPIPPINSPANADFPIVVTPSDNVRDVIPRQPANKPSHMFIDQACHYRLFRPLPLACVSHSHTQLCNFYYPMSYLRTVSCEKTMGNMCYENSQPYTSNVYETFGMD